MTHGNYVFIEGFIKLFNLNICKKASAKHHNLNVIKSNLPLHGVYMYTQNSNTGKKVLRKLYTILEVLELIFSLYYLIWKFLNHL